MSEEKKYVINWNKFNADSNVIYIELQEAVIHFLQVKMQSIFDNSAHDMETAASPYDRERFAKIHLKADVALKEIRRFQKL